MDGEIYIESDGTINTDKNDWLKAVNFLGKIFMIILQDKLYVV